MNEQNWERNQERPKEEARVLLVLHYYMVVSNVFHVHPYLERWSHLTHLTNIFPDGLVQPPTRRVVCLLDLGLVKTVQLLRYQRCKGSSKNNGKMAMAMARVFFILKRRSKLNKVPPVTCSFHTSGVFFVGWNLFKRNAPFFVDRKKWTKNGLPHHFTLGKTNVFLIFIEVVRSKRLFPVPSFEPSFFFIGGISVYHLPWELLRARAPSLKVPLISAIQRWWFRNPGSSHQLRER